MHRDPLPPELPVGTLYDGARVLEAVQYDANDDDQPYRYRLTDGQLVWIPVYDADANSPHARVNR